MTKKGIWAKYSDHKNFTDEENKKRNQLAKKICLLLADTGCYPFGGFCRDEVAGVPISDLDLYCPQYTVYKEAEIDKLLTSAGLVINFKSPRPYVRNADLLATMYVVTDPETGVTLPLDIVRKQIFAEQDHPFTQLDADVNSLKIDSWGLKDLKKEPLGSYLSWSDYISGSFTDGIDKLFDDSFKKEHAGKIFNRIRNKQFIAAKNASPQRLKKLIDKGYTQINKSTTEESKLDLNKIVNYMEIKQAPRTPKQHWHELRKTENLTEEQRKNRKVLAKKLAQLIAPIKGYIFGGFCRDELAGQDFSDVDVYLPSSSVNKKPHEQHTELNRLLTQAGLKLLFLSQANYNGDNDGSGSFRRDQWIITDPKTNTSIPVEFVFKLVDDKGSDDPWRMIDADVNGLYIEPGLTNKNPESSWDDRISVASLPNNFETKSEFVIVRNGKLEFRRDALIERIKGKKYIASKNASERRLKKIRDKGYVPWVETKITSNDLLNSFSKKNSNLATGLSLYFENHSFSESDRIEIINLVSDLISSTRGQFNIASADLLNLINNSSKSSIKSNLETYLRYGNEQCGVFVFLGNKDKPAFVRSLKDKSWHRIRRAPIRFSENEEYNSDVFVWNSKELNDDDFEEAAKIEWTTSETVLQSLKLKELFFVVEDVEQVVCDLTQINKIFRLQDMSLKNLERLGTRMKEIYEEIGFISQINESDDEYAIEITSDGQVYWRNQTDSLISSSTFLEKIYESSGTSLYEVNHLKWLKTFNDIFISRLDYEQRIGLLKLMDEIETSYRENKNHFPGLDDFVELPQEKLKNEIDANFILNVFNSMKYAAKTGRRFNAATTGYTNSHEVTINNKGQVSFLNRHVNGGKHPLLDEIYSIAPNGETIVKFTNLFETFGAEKFEEVLYPRIAKFKKETIDSWADVLIGFGQDATAQIEMLPDGSPKVSFPKEQANEMGNRGEKMLVADGYMTQEYMTGNSRDREEKMETTGQAMVQETKTFGQVFKNDITEAAYRGASRAATRLVVDNLPKLLEPMPMEQKHKDALADFFRTETGQSIISYGIGSGILYVPIEYLQDSEHAQKLGEEFRIEGLAGGLMVLFDIVKSFFNSPEMHNIFKQFMTPEAQAEIAAEKQTVAAVPEKAAAVHVDEVQEILQAQNRAA